MKTNDKNRYMNKESTKLTRSALKYRQTASINDKLFVIDNRWYQKQNPINATKESLELLVFGKPRLRVNYYGTNI
jgi:hypothetical protein